MCCPVNATTQQYTWVDISTALLTPTIAIIVAIIGGLQWWTNRNRLKLDLFDKRYEVYSATRDLLAKVTQRGSASDEDLFNYLMSTREAYFLFEDDLTKYLDSIYDKAIDIQVYTSELDGLPKGKSDERTELVGKRSVAKKWIISQIEELRKKFSPYIKLNH